MRGVQFRLGHNDHKVVEDFVSTAPTGVAAIAVDAKHLRVHAGAVEAARTAGLAVYIEPLTERLVAEGFSVGGLDYADVFPLTPGSLGTDGDRARLVARVVSPQAPVATAVTPPHFFVENDEVLDLNLALVRRTMDEFGQRCGLRAILAISRTFLARPGNAHVVAQRYRQAGVQNLELRMSPLGGEDEGVPKIRSAFDIVAAFNAVGLSVTLGNQGMLGETALALGIADSYSVGIGMLERYDYKAVLSRQQRPKRDDQAGGPQAGIYLAEAGVTLARRTAQPLFSDRRIRGHLACAHGRCAAAINGPLLDPRGHYLHARAADVAEILTRPPQWRPMLQRDRIDRALQVRATVNRFLTNDASPVKTRTLSSLTRVLDAGMHRAA